MWCYVFFNVNGLNFSMLFTVLQFLRSCFVERSNLGLFVVFSWLNSGYVVFFWTGIPQNWCCAFPIFSYWKGLDVNISITAAVNLWSLIKVVPAGALLCKITVFLLMFNKYHMGRYLEIMWIFLILFLHSDVHNSDNSIY